MSTHPASRLVQRAAATVAAGLLTVAIAAAPAAAQRPQGFAGTVRPSLSAMEVIGASLERGFYFSQQARYDLARREFRGAADVQMRNGYLPETALWQVAATHYAENQFLDAARTLDELATLAGQHGNVQVQGKALLEAAFLYRQAGELDRSKAAARQLKHLARSPEISAELRDEIGRRIGS